jgi:hypothetical protein
MIFFETHAYAFIKMAQPFSQENYIGDHPPREWLFPWTFHRKSALYSPDHIPDAKRDFVYTIEQERKRRWFV